MEIERMSGQAQGASPETWPKVAIIILNWNGWRDTIECLESISKVDYPNLELIVVDNASSDDSCQKITDWCSQNNTVCRESFQSYPDLKIEPIEQIGYESQEFRQLVLIRLSSNTGFCIGNNIGMMQAAIDGAEHFLILNNDTVVSPSFLKPLVELAQKKENVGLIGCLICYANEPSKIWFAGGKFNEFLESCRLLDGRNVKDISLDEVIETDWVSGCAMFIPRKVYEEIGGFDEDFFIWSEEWDYSLRVKQAGYKLFISTRSLIYHKVGGTLGVMKPLSYYYGTRNRLLLKRKHLSFKKRALFILFFVLSRIPRYIQFGLQGRWDLIRCGYAAIRDYFLGRTGKWDAHDEWFERQRIRSS
jgi:GT2 family glycosyltransferase